MSIIFMYEKRWLLDDEAVLFEIPKLREYLSEFVPEPEDWGEGCLFVGLDERFKTLKEFVRSPHFVNVLRQLEQRFREQSESFRTRIYFPDPDEQYPRYYLSEDGSHMLILCGIRTHDDKPLVSREAVLSHLGTLIKECEETPVSLPISTVITSPKPKPKATGVVAALKRVVAAIASFMGLS